ncbi:hypothetical protein V6Z11_A09G177800 [Gossypium hirsutum]
MLNCLQLPVPCPVSYISLLLVVFTLIICFVLIYILCYSFSCFHNPWKPFTDSKQPQ